MKLWIIYSKIVLDPNKTNALSWMMDEARALGIEAEILFAEDLTMTVGTSLHILHKGQSISPPDAAFLRCYDIAMIQQLELMGIMTFNNATALRDCLDKWRTHQLLIKAGIPTPKSLYGLHDVAFETVVDTLGLPFVLKDNYGKKGEQVYLVQNKADFLRGIEACHSPLFQAYIASSYGKDIRIHVIGDEAVTSVLRVSKGDFKSNYSQGGQALLHDLTPALAALAVKSAKALSLDFAGVDVLFDGDDYTICEVNGVPGFRTVGLTSKANIPQAMLKHIKEKYHARMDHI